MDDCKWQIVKYDIYDLDSMKVHIISLLRNV